MNHHSVAASTQ